MNHLMTTWELMDIFLVFNHLWIFGVILSWCTWYTQPSLPLMKNPRLRYHTRFSFPLLHLSLQHLILIQQVGPLDSPLFLAWEHNMRPLSKFCPKSQKWFKWAPVAGQLALFCTPQHKITSIYFTIPTLQGGRDTNLWTLLSPHRNKLHTNKCWTHISSTVRRFFTYINGSVN